MKYFLLILLLLPAAFAQNLSYEPQQTYYPEEGEILKRGFGITNNEKEDVSVEFICAGNLCEFLKYETVLYVPANFTVIYPITIFVPEEPEIRQYDATLSSGGNNINIKAIILTKTTKSIAEHLGSSLEIPTKGEPLQIRWAWVYLIIFIIGTAILSLLLWMVIQSTWSSVILSIIIVIFTIIVMIVRKIYGG